MMVEGRHHTPPPVAATKAMIQQTMAATANSPATRNTLKRRDPIATAAMMRIIRDETSKAPLLSMTHENPTKTGRSEGVERIGNSET